MFKGCVRLLTPLQRFKCFISVHAAWSPAPTGEEDEENESVHRRGHGFTLFEHLHYKSKFEKKKKKLFILNCQSLWSSFIHRINELADKFAFQVHCTFLPSTI